MLLRVLLVLIGYLVACVAFALVIVAFVFTPAELAGADADRFSMAGFQLFASSIQVIIFAAPLALVATAIAEWRRTDDWIFYALTAMLIAIVGFLAQYASELQGAPTIVFDPGVLRIVNLTQGSLVRIPGSWRDFAAGS